MCHAQNAVHGRADFVGHGGEKLALGSIGGLGLFLGVAELFLIVLARADVFLDGDEVGDLAGIVGDRGNAGRFPVQLAIFLLVQQFALPGLARHDGVPEVLVGSRRGGPGLQQARILAERLVAAVAGGAGEGVIDEDDVACGVGHEDGGAALGDGGAEQALLGLDLPARGNGPLAGA